MINSEQKLIIIGSGSAGYSAGIYAARANLNPILITGNDTGGQLMITTDVENYPGIPEIMGPELMERMKMHAEKFDVKIIYDHIKQVEVKKRNNKNHFVLYGSSIEKKYEAQSIIIATGASAKWLGIPNEEKFLGYGVSGCATCDGFFFKNKVVAVVGGGNTAAEDALFLTKFASKVYVIHRRDSLKAEKILQERMKANSKIEFLWNYVVNDIIGEDSPTKKITHLALKSTEGSNTERKLEVEGLFVAIGHKPNSDIFNGIVDIDKNGYILTKGKSTETSMEGVFAAGDIQDSVYRQAITSAGTGCMAALDAEKYLEGLDDPSKILTKNDYFSDIANIGKIIQNSESSMRKNIL